MRLLALALLLTWLGLLAACGKGDTSPSVTQTQQPTTRPAPTDGEPTTTATPVTPAPSPQLAPAESEFPAASTCNSQPDVVTFDLVPGVPSPRCAQATQGQHLHFDNHTGQTVVITFATSTITITDGQPADLEEAVGTYLAPGVHVAHVDYYGGNGPEIWVQP